MRIRSVLPALICLALSVTACGGRSDDAPVFAKASMTPSRTRVALGSPVDITYSFTVAAAPPKVDGDYRVFVHFNDADGEQMWTDDHVPPRPMAEWKAGETVSYTRTVFLPIYPYVGEASVVLGVYGGPSSERLRLDGEDAGQRAYRVATLQILPQTENVFLIYRDGWHQPEVAPDNAQAQWQWTKGEATLTFRNPRRDVLLYLHVDGRPAILTEPQTITVRVAGQPVDTFMLADRDEVLRRVQLSAAQMGASDTVEVRIGVDRTFVPATMPGSGSKDVRELGVRVYHAFVEPR